MFHCQDSVFVFPRDILDLSPIKFEDTFERVRHNRLPIEFDVVASPYLFLIKVLLLAE